MMRARAKRRALLHSPGFGLFGETLLVGIVAAVCMIPLITALAGVAAGSRHLRRHVDGDGDGIRLLVADLRDALRTCLVPGAGLVLTLGVVAFDLWLLSVVTVPGAGVVRTILLVVAATTVLVVTRFAARWEPGTAVRVQLRSAVHLTWRDPVGTCLLASAVAIAVVLVWMYPPLLLVVGGLIALAGVGVETRRVARAQGMATL